MNLTILTIVGIAGIIIGSYFGVRNKKVVVSEKENRELEIVELLNKKEKITNKDVRRLLGVSDSSAVRYLDNLERQGKIKQVGKTGHYTHYIRK